MLVNTYRRAIMEQLIANPYKFDHFGRVAHSIPQMAEHLLDQSVERDVLGCPTIVIIYFLAKLIVICLQTTR